MELWQGATRKGRAQGGGAPPRPHQSAPAIGGRAAAFRPASLRADAGDAGVAPRCRRAPAGRGLGSRHVYAAGQPAALCVVAGAGPAGGELWRVQRALGRQRPGAGGGAACGGNRALGWGRGLWCEPGPGVGARPGLGGGLGVAPPPLGKGASAAPLLVLPRLSPGPHLGGDDVLPCHERAHSQRPAGKHASARHGPASGARGVGGGGRDPPAAGKERALHSPWPE